jgi:methyltransferase (TIGR00027 family)
MKRDPSSQTAVMVCMARVAAHDRGGETNFRDPTAFETLAEPERQLVNRLRVGEAPRNLVERFRHAHLAREAPMMVARTLAIDDAVLRAQAPRAVILGTGLDGRAWRMAEFEDSVFFEVDHPASQRDKRARSERLKPTARDIRFVPVDCCARRFGRSSLTAAGHDCRYAFRVCTDRDISTLGAFLSSDVARTTRLMKHLRIVVADRHQKN